MRQTIEANIKPLLEGGNVPENALHRFDDIQQEAFDLMERDPFMRFRHTPAFVAIVTSKHRRTLTSIATPIRSTLQKKNSNSTGSYSNLPRNKDESKEDLEDIGMCDSISLRQKPITPTTPKSKIELPELFPIGPPGLEKIESVYSPEEEEEEKKVRLEQRLELGQLPPPDMVPEFGRTRSLLQSLQRSTEDYTVVV